MNRLEIWTPKIGPTEEAELFIPKDEECIEYLEKIR